jgi:hypothetical protein
MSTLKSINVIHPSSAVNNIVNDASGNVAVGGALTVGGVAAVAVAPGTAGNVLTSTGSAWASTAPTSGGAPSAIGQIPFSTDGSTYAATQKIVRGTVNAGGTNPFPSTGGPVIVDFTGIPSWVKRVTVMFSGVSTSGTSNWLIQVGDSGGVETTGYTSAGNQFNTSPAASASTAGFLIEEAPAAAAVSSGHAVITNVFGNIWVSSSVLVDSIAPTIAIGAGTKTLSDVLTQVRITTVNGTDTFDAGSINILYE